MKSFRRHFYLMAYGLNHKEQQQSVIIGIESNWEFREYKVNQVLEKYAKLKDK